MPIYLAWAQHLFSFYIHFYHVNVRFRNRKLIGCMIVTKKYVIKCKSEIKEASHNGTCNI